MASPKITTHDFIAWPTEPGKTWFGFKMRNIGNHTILPGRAVSLLTLSGADEINIQVTRLSTGSASADKAERRRIIGVATEKIAIAEGSTYYSGYVAMAGYLTNVMVTGTIAYGEMLMPALGTDMAPGLFYGLESHDQAADDAGARKMGISYGTNTGTSKAIPAFILSARF